MPEKFEGFGIALLYPDSWNLDGEVEGDSVSIESPEGAFLMITRCADPLDASEALARAQAAMREEYDEVEREPIEKKFSGQTMAGEILRFVFLDLIVTSQLLLLTNDQHTYLIQTQAEDRDHDRLQLVFDAMLTSFCQNLVGQA